MIKLNVCFTSFAGKQIQAGELIVSEPDFQGRLQGQFRYHPEYVESPFAIPLDPFQLPLSSDIFDVDRPKSGVHGVFEDSLPDDWGRKIMVRRHMLERNEQRVPYFLRLLGRNGLGALSYEDGNVSSPVNEIPDRCHLARLQDLAQQFEKNPVAVESEIALLFQAGSSPGDARPKALVSSWNNQIKLLSTNRE